MVTFEEQLDWGVDYGCGDFGNILNPVENPPMYRHIKQYMPDLPTKYAVYTHTGDMFEVFPKLFNSREEIETFVIKGLDNPSMTIDQINFFKNHMHQLYKTEEI